MRRETCAPDRFGRWVYAGIAEPMSRLIPNGMPPVTLVAPCMHKLNRLCFFVSPDAVYYTPAIGNASSERAGPPGAPLSAMFRTIACEIFWIHGLQLLPMPKVSSHHYVTVELPGSAACAGAVRGAATQPRIHSASRHKGQVVAMCRQLGHLAPDTDFQRR